MSHGFKNIMIGMFFLSTVFYYVLNGRHAALVDEALGLCIAPDQIQIADASVRAWQKVPRKAPTAQVRDK